MTNEDIGILVVDDEFSVRDSLCNWFRKEGYRVGEADSGPQALRRLEEAAWDLVLLDIRMPGMDGLELQERIKRADPDIVIIVITGYASVETAVQALKEGAFDYITKPIEPDLLAHLVRNAAEQRRLRAENLRLRAHIEGLAGREEIVGESAGMRRVLELVDSAARTDTPVLIRGESGTGKAHIARAIHANGRRRYFPFVPVSCSAAPGLVEREIFGHEASVPDAGYARPGRLGMADGGTLFLDEVSAVPPDTQVALLSVLDTGEFTRPGAGKPTRVDLRLICATTRTLDELATEGRCREDFLYRINVVTIDLPPLAARRDDVPLLAEHFLRKHAAELNKNVTGFDPDALELLGRYDWPGNVRELANAIERAAAVSRAAVIRAEDLPAHVRRPSAAPGGESLAAIEKAHIARILARTGRDLSRTAEILGLDGAELLRRLGTHGLSE